MEQNEPDEMIEQLRGYIEGDVAGGFLQPEDIIRCAVEMLADDYDAAVLRPHAERLTLELLREHADTQTGWPAITDCDRLEMAFSELEETGILARHNAICCQTCAGSEVWKEVTELIDLGVPIRGYTYYHEQDVESVVESGSLHLSYGAVHGGEPANSIAIGHDVVKMLELHGLNVQWDGSLATRILVNLKWQKRRYGA